MNEFNQLSGDKLTDLIKAALPKDFLFSRIFSYLEVVTGLLLNSLLKKGSRLLENHSA